jgi:hypothetical protein
MWPLNDMRKIDYAEGERTQMYLQVLPLEELERLTNEFITPLKTPKSDSTDLSGRSISEEDLPGADFRKGHYIGQLDGKGNFSRLITTYRKAS